MSVPGDLRFQKTRRCPVCGGGDNMPRGQGSRCSGFLSSDGRYAHCTREEHAGHLQPEIHDGPTTWAHLLEGPCRCGKTHREAPSGVEIFYDYVDAQGELLFQVVRLPGKKFRQRRPDGNGGWIWSLNGTQRVLYRLPAVLEAAELGETIYIVEGEKDVHSVERAGGIATCNPGGAGKWRPEYAQALRGAQVIIVTDLDPPTKKNSAGIDIPHLEGQRHALAVRATIPRATIVQPLTGKDVSDHLAAGHTLADLQPFPEPDIQPLEPVEDEPPHSWTPKDLIQDANDPPEPPTISGLVYPGRRHLFSGEPESLKSWAAMILCTEQIRQGNTVAYIDFEMGGRETLSRLRDIGLTDQELTEHFIYIEPDEAFFGDQIRTDTNHLLQTRRPTLIIIDAFTGALQVHQLDPNKSVDIETFYRRVIDQLRAHGAAIVVLDHLPKDPLNRGKFAIGSERKVGAAEVHLGFEVITPFGRGRTGRAKIATHKDRPGYLPRPKTAELELTSREGTITWTWHPPEQLEPGEDFRPTHLMEKTSRHTEPEPEPVSLTQVLESITGRDEFVRKALDQLVKEGYIQETKGPRGARLFKTIKPYRETTDPLLKRPLPTSSHLFREEVEATSSPKPPPTRGGRGQREEVKAPQLDDLFPEEDPDADIPY